MASLTKSSCSAPGTSSKARSVADLPGDCAYELEAGWQPLRRIGQDSIR